MPTASLPVSPHGSRGRPLPGSPPTDGGGAAGAIAGWLVALFLTVRALLLLAPIGAAFVVTTAYASILVEEPLHRLAVGAAVALGVPLLIWWRTGALLSRTRFGAPSLGWFTSLSNLVVVAAVGFGFADDTGRALRRHGDWFVGDRNGLAARAFRLAIAGAAGYLEKFDPPPELASLVLPPDPTHEPMGPWRPGEKPPERLLEWFHPLAGPRRAMPMSEGRRFGAVRPQPRPAECELGHCGVDLGSTIGEAVFATFDGLVERIEPDEERGGRAGRYIRLGHRGGSVVTRYIHLDSIRDGLKEGDTVRGGELIGRLGRSGVHNSGPHLHFGISLRDHGRGGAEHYIDPEPLLRVWKLPDPASLLSGAMARATALPTASASDPPAPDDR